MNEICRLLNIRLRDINRLMGERPDSTIMQQLDEISEDGKANLNKVLEI